MSNSILILLEMLINLKKYFKNTREAINSYKNKNLEIHSYIWIKENSKKDKIQIKILKKSKNKKVKKFILRLKTIKNKLTFNKINNIL